MRLKNILAGAVMAAGSCTALAQELYGPQPQEKLDFEVGVIINTLPFWPGAEDADALDKEVDKYLCSYFHPEKEEWRARFRDAETKEKTAEANHAPGTYIRAIGYLQETWQTYSLDLDGVEFAKNEYSDIVPLSTPETWEGRVRAWQHHQLLTAKHDLENFSHGQSNDFNALCGPLISEGSAIKVFAIG